MEIHWVAVAVMLQWRGQSELKEEVSSPGTFCAHYDQVC